MSQFEDNLWKSVLDERGDDLARGHAATATGTASTGRRTRPRVLAGATVAAAATATAVTLAVSATTSPPAFAVTRHHDGSVSVKILGRSGIAGANRQLAKLGIPARAVEVAPGKFVPGCRTSPWKIVAIHPVASTVTTPKTATTVVARPRPSTVTVLSPAPPTTVAKPKASTVTVPKTATTVVAKPRASTVTAPKTATTVVAKPRSATHTSGTPVLTRSTTSPELVVVCTPAPVSARHGR